jgi:hypothetical protein
VETVNEWLNKFKTMQYSKLGKRKKDQKQICDKILFLLLPPKIVCHFSVFPSVFSLLLGDLMNIV